MLFQLYESYFSGKAWELKMLIFPIFNCSFHATKQKFISKKLSTLAAKAVFVIAMYWVFA
jgi:hypothetical protein